jgi:PAS domain S-box-containing protein
MNKIEKKKAGKSAEDKIEKLKRSEQKFRDIALCSGDFIWEINSKGMYTFASVGVKKILGYSPKEILGKSPFALMPEKERDKVRKIFTKLVKAKKNIVDIRNWNIAKNGRYVCLLTNGVPIFDEKSHLIGYRGIDKDITQRVLGEEDISAWKKRYDLVSAASGQITYECNLYSGTLIWSNTIEKVLGYTLDEMKGGIEQWKSLIHPEDTKNAMKLLDIAGKNHRPYNVEYRFRHKKGYYLLMKDKGLFFKTENIYMMIGMMIDITEQKRSELLLKESEKKYRNLFTNAGEVILINDIRGMILDINNAITKYRFKRDEMIGKNITDFVCPEYWNQGREDLLKNLKGEKTEGITNIRTPKGERICSYKDTPIINHGKVVGVQTILTDITEQKLAEANLKKKNTELLKKDDEILKINHRLGKANEQLAHLNEVKDNFLSTVSHELKTPLTSIKSYNQIIYDGILGTVNEKQKEAIDIVLSSTDHLNRLINELLDVSRYEAGKKEFDFENFNIKEVILEVVKEFKPTLDSSGAGIRLKSSDIFLFADKDKIKEVFRNLISNSVKYRSKASLVIHIRVRIFKKSVEITVKDNGIGISKKNQRNLFNKFYQVDQGLTRKTEGAGLGLSIVKHIVEGHKGKIRANSKIGKGTEFIILLPKKTGLAK